jgi:hypothetical protein
MSSELVNSSSENSEEDIELNKEDVRLKLYDLFFGNPVIMDGFQLDPVYPDYEALREFLAARTKIDFSINLFSLGKILWVNIFVKWIILGSQAVQEYEIGSDIDLDDWLAEAQDVSLLQDDFNGPIVIPLLVLCTLILND